MVPHRTQRPAPSTDLERATGLRAIGVCAIAATLVHIISGALHGALTAGADQSSSVAVYEHVLAAPTWAAINVTMLLAIVAWLGVLVGIERAGHREPSWRDWLSRLATLVLAVGIAAASLLFLTDAIVVPSLAEQWQAAGPERRAELVAFGDTVQAAIRTPLFHVLPLFVYGLPFALVGAAHIGGDSLLPTWLGWLTMMAGTMSFVVGLSLALGSTLLPEIILWTVIQPLLWIWGIGTGITLWRRSAEDARHTRTPAA